jgi:NAD(P)H-hydrate epimerase
MRQAEAAANAAGETYAMLMERAGQATAAAVGALTEPAGQKVLILIGPGNNGGDGLVAAHYLHGAGASVCCYIWKRAAEGDANLARAGASGCRLLWAEGDAESAALSGEAERADVILDALLGAGATRPIEGSLAELLACVRRVVEVRRSPRRPAGGDAPLLLDPLNDLPERPATPLVVAVDVPSGLNCDSGVADPATLPADLTVTFGYPKPGQFVFPAAQLIGKLLVADIGLSPYAPADASLRLMTAAQAAERLPARPLDAHKGSFGRALIIAGSVNYMGAPSLAAQAAARAGAGLVTLALPERIVPIVAAHQLEPTYLVLPHVMGVISPDATRILEEKIGSYQAALIGPGLDQEKEVMRFVHEFLAGKERVKPKHRGRIGFVADSAPAEANEDEDAEPEGRRMPPLVIDADALNALAQEENWWEKIPAGSILTPHPGEMARLLKVERDAVQADRVGVARRAAQDWKQIVVLKGAYTVIAAPEGPAYLLPFANPMLATAGVGDVLAGVIVGLLAQGLAPLDAALAGAFAHGLAGEQVAEEWEQQSGTIASDLIAALPATLDRLRA